MIKFENGLTVYFAGSTAPTMDMTMWGRMYKPDVAILQMSAAKDPQDLVEEIKMLRTNNPNLNGHPPPPPPAGSARRHHTGRCGGGGEGGDASSASTDPGTRQELRSHEMSMSVLLGASNPLNKFDFANCGHPMRVVRRARRL
jgi:hypothetical protein